MRILIIVFALGISTVVFARETGRMTGRNKFVGGFSCIMSPNMASGSGGALLFTGFEKTVGNPAKNGYSFSGEIRVKSGFLMDLDDKTYLYVFNRPDLVDYNGVLAGMSVLIRPNFEIFEGNFLFLEGELGLMYEYMRTRVKKTVTNITTKKSGGCTVPQYGVKLGWRSGKCSLFAGFYYFNHTKAVNSLIPKESKITDSQEGLGGELGFGFYF